MAELYIEYEGTKIFYFKTDIISKRFSDKCCPLCTEIIEGEAIILLNNDKLFPNIAIHKKCLSFDVMNEPYKTAVINIIINSYTEYKEFKQKYKAWIVKENS